MADDLRAKYVDYEHERERQQQIIESETKFIQFSSVGMAILTIMITRAAQLAHPTIVLSGATSGSRAPHLRAPRVGHENQH